MIKKVVYVELVPTSGMWLTQKELEINEERIFSDKVFTPNGQEDKWTEWTDATKREYEMEQQARMRALEDAEDFVEP